MLTRAIQRLQLITRNIRHPRPGGAWLIRPRVPAAEIWVMRAGPGGPAQGCSTSPRCFSQGFGHRHLAPILASPPEVFAPQGARWHLLAALSPCTSRASGVLRAVPAPAPPPEHRELHEARNISLVSRTVKIKLLPGVPISMLENQPPRTASISLLS